MSSWTNNEQSIIRKINQELNLGLVDDSDDYSHSDASSHKYIVEIKDRNFPSNHHFGLDGWFLEKYKYDSLCKKKTDNQEILYINSFIDNVIAIWNLSKIENFNWEVGFMNKTTYGNDPRINKLVAKLKIKDAITIRR